MSSLLNKLWHGKKNWCILQSKQNKQPSYCWFFDRMLPGDHHGAWHSSELWYFFGTQKNCWRPFIEHGDKISDIMSTALFNFAKTGNPNGNGIENWTPTTSSQKKMMIWGEKMPPVDHNVHKQIRWRIKKTSTCLCGKCFCYGTMKKSEVLVLEAVRMDETTWRIEDKMMRMFLLKGEKKALLIDSGVSCEDVKTLSESLVDVPVELINTHADPDHIASNHLFSLFYMHSDEGEDVHQIPVSDQDVLDLGNRKIKVIHIPGHTQGSIALLDVSKRILYTGDSVQDGNIYMFGTKRNTKQFGASLKKLITMEDEFDWICASHGTPMLPKEYIKKVLHAWDLCQTGQIVPKDKEIHGQDIHWFQHEFCGFYCDNEKTAS